MPENGNGGYAPGDPLAQPQVTHYTIHAIMRSIIEVKTPDPTPVAFFVIPKTLFAQSEDDPTNPPAIEMFVKLSALPEELRTQVRAEIEKFKPQKVVPP